VRTLPVFGGKHGTSRPLLGQDAPIPSGAQFAVDDPKFRIQPIQDSKAVWIDNMDATHGTFRHWAMGLRTGTVDGAFLFTTFQLIQEISPHQIRM
jgi:hypothetical protein